MKTALLCIVVLSLVLSVGVLARADEAAKAPTVETHLKRVALFKNGFGFFVREGKLTDAQRVVVLGPFAAPTHGTFWISTPSRAQLASAVARQVTGSEDIPAGTIQELLRANVGRTVKLWMHSGPEPSLTGKLLAFAPSREQPRYDPYALGWPQGIMPVPGASDYGLLETDEGVIVFQPSSVYRADFTGDRPSVAFPQPSEKVQLEAVFGDPTPGDWLSVSYLAKGITWAPSYVIDLSDPKQARLTANALIVNEAEDLAGTHVDLVTGFPHLQFADILSPIARKEGLGQFLQSLARGSSHPGEASVMTQVMSNVAAADMEFARGVVTPSYGAATAGRVTEDLFLYPVENVTLRKGETGYYPLFTESVPYADFYDWKIPDYVNPEARYVEPGESEIVWHSVRLTNTMAMPWTTAPAQLMKDGQIVGQDTLRYTAPSAASAVRITQAVGVKAEQTEVEVSREREAVRLYGDSFDRVTVTGTLRIANFTRERVVLEITKDLSGDVKASTPKAQDVTLARGLRAMNPAHELKWKIELRPGETMAITYTYQALIRR